MEALVYETISNLREVKKMRLEERGEILSGLLEDDVVVAIDTLIELLKDHYLKQ